MLLKIIVVANLPMLAKGAIEVPLSKVSHLSKNVLNSVNRRNIQPQPMRLYGGLHTKYHHYMADITIGNQTYRLIIDTGSSDFVVRGKDCVTFPAGDTCDSQTPPVGDCNSGGSSKSNSGNNTGIEGTIEYGLDSDDFVKFHIYITDVTMAGVQVHGLYLGYIYQHAKELFGNDSYAADEVLGLGSDDESEIFKVTDGVGKTLLSTLSAQHGFANSFAICFNPSGIDGKMIIGGGELANMQFTPLILNVEDTYTVNILSISINGITLPNTADLKTLVDSGATSMLVAEQILGEFASKLCPFLKAIGWPCTHSLQWEYFVPKSITVTPKQLAKLPNIKIDLLGATLIVSPKSYFIFLKSAHGEKNEYQYGISSTGYYASRTAVILGTPALLGYWVYFDNEKHRVGISSVKHCDQ